jgi:hypothetical protein
MTRCCDSRFVPAAALPLVAAWAALVAGFALSAGAAEADRSIEAAVAARRGKTVLSRLAVEMKPGTWARLETDGPGELRSAPPPSKGLDIMTWSDDAHWDSRTGRFFFMGLRQRRRFIAYDEETNAWRDVGLPDDHQAAGSPPVASQFGHTYSRNALDPETSRFYHMEGAIFRYDIAAGRWTRLPPGGSYGMTGVIEFFSARQGLVNLCGEGKGGLRFFSEPRQAWEQLGDVPVHGYHSLGRHNPFRREVLLAGGNHSPRTVVRLKQDGTIERLKDAPENLSIRSTQITVDPASGRYLIMTAERRFYEFDADRNEYRLIDDFTETVWPFGRYDAPVAAYVPEHGVTMWASRETVLYKHEAAQ